MLNVQRSELIYAQGQRVFAYLVMSKEVVMSE